LPKFIRKQIWKLDLLASSDVAERSTYCSLHPLERATASVIALTWASLCCWLTGCFMTLGPHTVAALVVTGLTGVYFIHVTVSVHLPIYLPTYTRHSEMIWAVASVLANNQL
jgi:hypothetical protein